MNTEAPERIWLWKEPLDFGFQKTADTDIPYVPEFRIEEARRETWNAAIETIEQWAFFLEVHPIGSPELSKRCELLSQIKAALEAARESEKQDG